tara:strand:+ start:316 stop:552 length:237 start_codon:yes stop_codon:yes gene_type:complete
MRTLIQPEVKIKIASFEKSTNKIKEKSNNSNFILDSKFYQKIFVILLTFCIFLIFPESPQDSEALCKKYHSTEACIVW